MIPSWSEEVSSGVVSIHSPVLRPVEYGVVDRQHGSDGQYLFTALVPEGRSRVEINNSVHTYGNDGRVRFGGFPLP